MSDEIEIKEGNSFVHECVCGRVLAISRNQKTDNEISLSQKDRRGLYAAIIAGNMIPKLNWSPNFGAERAVEYADALIKKLEE